ncbi:helix-turn-helix transcriptional regulator [Thermococcus sp. Bubb.Bath]|uniref:ArsR/SmtB family transcription factor n=1 Tax=Thermococcus sp. Bubb.Bath TaxID=1638242 RepID=UPI00143BC1CD|nr:metalloregulator ArsR/SmtB family transcription factor [Thermococcus sp. Bubb.Bath]NJF25439.1 transcriptional regulator [Thermococcus sp. Bubb.Bath]
MKVRELIAGLDEKQRRSVSKCLDECRLVDPEEEVLVEVSKEVLDFVKVLANPIRLSILKMLMNRWMCVCLIAKALDQDQTLISHHLRSLKRMGLLEERREGKIRFYRTNPKSLREGIDGLIKEIGVPKSEASD